MYICIFIYVLLCEVVQTTLTEYVELFERFAKEPIPYETVKDQGDQDKWEEEILSILLYIHLTDSMLNYD